MGNLSTVQEFKPLLTPRRSELTAWGLTVLMSLVVIFAPLKGLGKSGGMIFLVFLGFSAVMMSVGNWVERNTYLRIEDDRVTYYNGAKEVSLGWEEITRVEVLSSRFGDRIIVSSESAGFRYQSLGNINMNGKISGRVGFEHGEQILEMILEQSGLARAERRQTDRSYYYSRD
jgi:hypothetical protein